MVPCHWIIQCDHVHRIYPIEIEIKNTTDTDLSALYIDHLDTDTRLLTATKYMCHIWSRICSVCLRQIMSFPLSLHISKYDLSSDFNTSCTPGATSRTGTAYLSSSRFIGARASYSLFSVKYFVDHWLFVWSFYGLFFSELRCLNTLFESLNFSVILQVFCVVYIMKSFNCYIHTACPWMTKRRNCELLRLI